MVETATFRIFDRPRPQASPAVPPMPPLAEPLPMPSMQDVRARRRAARDAMRQEPPSPAPAPLPVPAAPSAPSSRQYRNGGFMLDYHLLGVANPVVYTVTGSLHEPRPAPPAIQSKGVHSLARGRTTPWSGLAYEICPDGRTGLAAGTRVLTARGLVPVEALVPGELVLALRGPSLLPIQWIGRSIATAPPVRIAADAFGPGRPAAALCIGIDHPVFVDCQPITAQDLPAGTAAPAGSATELFHIDVGIAEVLLAEGVPVASGDR